MSTHLANNGAHAPATSFSKQLFDLSEALASVSLSAWMLLRAFKKRGSSDSPPTDEELQKTDRYQQSLILARAELGRFPKGLVDDKRLPPISRWSARLALVLNALANRCLLDFSAASPDSPDIAFMWLMGTHLDEWGDEIERLKEFLYELKGVEVALTDENGMRPPTGGVDGSAGVLPIMLSGWESICAVLGMKDTKEGRALIHRVRKQFPDGCPISTRQGSKPLVEKSKLLEWWSIVLDRWQELNQRKRDRKATVSVTYEHGKESAVVVPEISGSVRKRRKPKEARKT